MQPEFYQEAKVVCNGQEVMTVGGTQAEYVVDIWSETTRFSKGRRAIMTMSVKSLDSGTNMAIWVICRSLKPWMVRANG